MSDAQQRLLAITATHLKSLTELEEVLDAEAAALGSRDLEKLQAATDRKNALLSQLENAGQQLSSLCREAGVELRGDVLLGAGVTGAMAHAWSRMRQLLERCDLKNRVNGVAISASRNFAENLLALLQGQQGTAKTYGRQGTLYREPPAKTLGSV